MGGQDNVLARLKQAQESTAKMLTDWRATKLTEHTLPSGLSVFMRDVDLFSMAFDGKIPNTMLPLVDQLQTKGNTVKMEDMGQFGELIALLCIECIVHPPMAQEADDTHTSISELSGADRMDVFMYANREVFKLATFLPGKNEPVDAVLPGGNVSPEAVEPAGA